MIDETQMPAPDTIVNCKVGGPIAAMFYYAAGEQDLSEIASEHGFDTKAVGLDEDDALMERWADGDAEVLAAWTPPEIEGWTMAAKLDNEDGPMAIYIRKSAPPAA